MLVSSSPGVIELLPALPDELKSGAISGIKCRNQVTIENLSWNLHTGAITCTLRSAIDQSITLIHRSGIKTIKTTAPVLATTDQFKKYIALKAGVSTHVFIAAK